MRGFVDLWHCAQLFNVLLISLSLASGSDPDTYISVHMHFFAFFWFFLRKNLQNLKCLTYLCIGFRKHPVPTSQTLSKQRALLTRFEQGFNEVFKNPLQREIVVFGRIFATAISPQGDINYSLFIKPKPPHGVGTRTGIFDLFGKRRTLWEK